VKLVREHICERFIKDSDPISDMNIGGIDIYEKSRELIKNLDIGPWLEYLASLEGKRIGGYFKRGVFLKYHENENYYNFIIVGYKSYISGLHIYFLDKNKNNFKVIQGRRYIII